MGREGYKTSIEVLGFEITQTFALYGLDYLLGGDVVLGCLFRLPHGSPMMSQD